MSDSPAPASPAPTAPAVPTSARPDVLVEAEARHAEIVQSRTDETAIAIEAEVVSACLVALGRLPLARRESVLTYLRDRLIRSTHVELLLAVCASMQPEMDGLRAKVTELEAANRRLTGQLADGVR